MMKTSKLLPLCMLEDAMNRDKEVGIIKSCVRK